MLFDDDDTGKVKDTEEKEYEGKVSRHDHLMLAAVDDDGNVLLLLPWRRGKRDTMVTFIVAFARHKDGKGSIKTHTKHNIWYINFIRHR